MATKELPKLPFGEGSMTYKNDNLIMYRKTIVLPDGDKVKKSVYGKTPQECMKKMRETEEEVRLNAKKSDRLLLEAMQDWLEKVKKPTLKPQSYRRLFSTINHNIAESEIGHYRYQTVTTDELQALIAEYNEKNYSHSSIKKLYDALNAFYKYVSIKDKFDNPMLLVSMPTINNINKESKTIEFFEQGDIDKFVSECGATWKTGTPKYQGGNMYGANIYLGMRIGELLALQWKDIDLEKRTIYVSKTLIEEHNPNYDESDPDSKKVRFTVQKTNKTNKNRYVPINDKALALIQEHKKTITFSDPDDYVISTRNRRTTTVKNATDTIQKIEKNAETSVQKTGSHALRHTCASLYFRAGVPIEVICKILGNSREVCESTYIHFVEEQLKNAASQITTIIEI